MTQNIITVKKEHIIENVISKSRFIAHIKPVQNEDEAKAFIAAIKKEHKDATHNCSAYTIGPEMNIQKANDDGEPTGTAGVPMLDILKKLDVHNACVVVTRYFGGIKLGGGGLIRAYSGAVRAIVEIVVFNNSIMYGVTLIVIAAVTSAIGPFLKQNDVLSLLILNVVTIIILFGVALVSPIYTLSEVIILIPISLIITLASAITFVDIWHFFSLVNRYENEDKYDYLTGLGNVKEFDRHLNEISRKAEKEHQSIALLLIDIDGFKDVNDTYSHKSGDAVLKQMSQLLKNYVPNQFKIFRNGGEEFSVVIHNYSLDQSVKLAENIRSGVEKSSFHLPNKEVIKLSVSIGVGYLTDDDPKSQRKVFKDADDMVHVAKNQGRNKVMFNPIINL